MRVSEPADASVPPLAAASEPVLSALLAEADSSDWLVLLLPLLALLERLSVLAPLRLELLDPEPDPPVDWFELLDPDAPLDRLRPVEPDELDRRDRRFALLRSERWGLRRRLGRLPSSPLLEPEREAAGRPLESDLRLYRDCSPEEPPLAFSADEELLERFCRIDVIENSRPGVCGRWKESTESPESVRSSSVASR